MEDNDFRLLKNETLRDIARNESNSMENRLAARAVLIQRNHRFQYVDDIQYLIEQGQ